MSEDKFINSVSKPDKFLLHRPPIYKDFESLSLSIHKRLVGIRLKLAPKIINMKEEYMIGTEGSFFIIKPLLGIAWINSI